MCFVLHPQEEIARFFVVWFLQIYNLHNIYN